MKRGDGRGRAAQTGGGTPPAMTLACNSMATSREEDRPPVGAQGTGEVGTRPARPAGSFPAGHQPGLRVGMGAQLAATQGWVADGGLQKRVMYRALATEASGDRNPTGEMGMTADWLAAGSGKGHAHGRERGPGGVPGPRGLKPLWSPSGPRRAVLPSLACVRREPGSVGRGDNLTNPSERAR